MLKKLASPRRRAQPPTASGTSLDSTNGATGLVQALTTKSPDVKKKKEPKPKKEPKEKPKVKLKKENAKLTEKAGDNALGVSEATATGAALSDEVSNAGVTDTEVKSPSPRKSIERASRRKTLFEQVNGKSPTKKALASPKKRLMKLPKPEKKLVDKKREAKPQDETIDPNAESTATTEKNPLSPSKSDATGESPKRKSRWKMPDMKHHNSKASNNQKEPIHEEDKVLESQKAPLSPTSENNNSIGSRETPHSTSFRVRGKRGKLEKRQISAAESLSGDSEQENQTNVLSPIRRHKPDPDDTMPIPESPYNLNHVQKRPLQLDVPPAFQPEVHLIGEIVSGHGFGTAGGLTCKWRVEYGSRWNHIAGDQFGQTQADYPSTAPWTSDPDVAVWAHPIDLHFATSAFQGWPKLLLQVWRVDPNAKLHVLGYGFVPVPFAAGQHKLWVSLWRPLGTTKEELDVHLLGRTTELKSDDVLFNAAWSERCRLRTVSTGKVLVHIGVLLRHFQAGVIEA